MKKKWTYETCKIAAEECKTYREFCEKYPQAYYVSHKNGWDFIKRKTKKMGYWTYSACEEEAKKYSNTTDFVHNCPGGYDAARKKGWLWDWFERKSHGHNYWTYDRCVEESKKYKTYTEFNKGSHQAYHKSRYKTKWIYDFTWLINDIAKMDEETKKYLIYKYFFVETNAVYVGLTLNLKERDRTHNRLCKKNGKSYYDTVKQYSIENNMPMPKPIVIEENLTANEAKIREDYWVSFFKDNGFIVLNKGKTGEKSSSMGGPAIKWTYEKTYEEAKKYASRTEFQKRNKGAYNAARKNKWLDGYEWLKPKIHPNGYWTFDRCLNEASDCKTLSEFEKKHGSAYASALRNKWIDLIKKTVWGY